MLMSHSLTYKNKFLCSKCNERERYILNDGRLDAYCRPCRSKKSLGYQKKFNYRNDKTPFRMRRQKSRWILRNLLKAGKIRKENCNLCHSKNNLQFHQPDPNEPLSFIVVCNDCHRLIHNIVIREVK